MTGVSRPKGLYSLRSVCSAGVGRDDAAERVTAQRGDVARCQILECGLVAEPPGDIAAVQFLRTKDREVDPGTAQQQDQGAERALGAQVEGAVAEPEQHVALALVGQHGEAQVHGPVEAAGSGRRRGCRSPSVPPALRRPCRGGAQFERLETAEVDHGIDVLDHHRAFCTQARQVVQAQRVSGWTMGPMTGWMGPPWARPIGRPGWPLPA